MPIYNVTIDFAKSWNQKHFQVKQIELEAENSQHANEIVTNHIQTLISSGDLPDLLFYPWEISEDDKQ
jgi:hypothetical protein